jgi:hypothetical protein
MRSGLYYRAGKSDTTQPAEVLADLVVALAKLSSLSSKPIKRALLERPEGILRAEEKLKHLSVTATG